MNDLFFYAAALMLGGLAGSLIADRKPVCPIHGWLRRHRGFVLTIIGVSFAVGLVLAVLR